MNNNKDIRILQIKVEMQALITGVEGLIAENKIREMQGLVPQYGMSDFNSYVLDFNEMYEVLTEMQK